MNPYPQRAILITGAAGFIGSSLANHLSQSGFNVVRLDNRSTAADATNNKLVDCDVSSPTALLDVLESVQPKVIIHCAALKNLPSCEDDKIKAFATNTLSTEVIGNFAKRTTTKVVYLSSDVIFDGIEGNYRREDNLRPINWYGKTKAFSESILATVPGAVICRTALVIGSLNSEYKNLLATELTQSVLVNQTLLPQYVYQKLKNEEIVRMPASIISNPTPVELLCQIVERVITKDVEGIFHATGPDKISRFDMARLIASLFGFNNSLIVADETNISALRPRNISMYVDDTFDQLGIATADWRLDDYLSRKELYA